MKTTLSIEESAKLIELGVDAKLASTTCLDFNGTFAYISGEEADFVREHINKHYYTENPIVFTLSDILSILPKEIKHKGDPYGLDMNWDGCWGVSYFNAVNFVTPYKKGSIAFEQAPELIDALYQLLIWAITNNYVKTEKK